VALGETGIRKGRVGIQESKAGHWHSRNCHQSCGSSSYPVLDSCCATFLHSEANPSLNPKPPTAWYASCRWRWCFWLGAVPAAALVLLSESLVESPRWLAPEGS